MTKLNSQDNLEKKAQAQYLILQCLDQHEGEMEYRDLKRKVRKASENIAEADRHHPIPFFPSASPDRYKSRTFVRALSWCFDSETVDEEGGVFILTKYGERYISNTDRYPVPDSFKKYVDSLFESDEKLQLVSD